MSIIDDAKKKLLGHLSGEPKKLNEVSDQSPEEISLVNFVKSKVDEARQTGARVASEGIWMTNIAYLLGYQVYYDTQSRQYRPTDGLAGGNLSRNRVHVNKILPTIHNRLARLYQNAPKYEVRPEGHSSEDKDAARLGLEIINDIWDKQKVDQKRLSLLMWLQQCGYSFMKVSWDPTLGKPMTGIEGEDEGYEGDIRIDPISAFEIFPDPLAKTMDECQWIVQAKVRKLDHFRMEYPERGHLVKEESAWLLSAQYENRINSMSSSGIVTNSTDTQMKSAAIEVAYYEKRSRKHPQGRFVVTANGVLLHDGELAVGELPFCKFDDIVIGGKFAAEAMITHLRPMQDGLNEVISKRAAWTRQMLAGKYIAAKGHGLMAEALDNESGEVLEYDPVANAAPPEPLAIPQIPQYAYVEEERWNAMINDVSGINEISRGQLPAAGIPAIGMQFIQEQDETRIGVVTEQHEQSYAHMGSLVLKYASEFYKTPRLLKIAGKGMQYTVKNFVGADIKDSHDVVVIKGSTLPRSKVLRRQEILNALSQGILGNPQDPKLQQKLLRAIEWGDLAEIWTDQAVTDQQIAEHLQMIKDGTQPPVHELDMHAEFVRQLNEIRISDTSKTMSPLSQQILESTIQAHLDWIIKLQNPGMQQEGQMAEQMQAAGDATAPSDIESELAVADLKQNLDGHSATQDLAGQNQNIADQLNAQNNPEQV